MVRLWKKSIVGLALGAGGAKGFAHLGVLRVFERNHLPIAIITGSSAGALVGAMYAQSGSVDKAEARIRELLATDFIKRHRLDLMIPHKEREHQKILERIGYFVKQEFVLTRSFTRMSFFNSEIVNEALSFLLDDRDIEETEIPFGAVAVDYLSGERVLITEGPIRQAVAASCCIPGIFPPVPLNDMLLVDGSVISRVPVTEAREMGANFVVGVDVSSAMKKGLDIRNGLELMFRADEITGYYLNQQNLQKADIIIRPDVGRVHWADFENIDNMINSGSQTTEKLTAEIKQKLRRNKFHF
ncbi:MAG TPA: patatin-like phospholipase family protein [Caldithrix sp.]|nr:patatin-like phospholipase family protein [Caldithrix sp.]